jgi:transcription antitermination factor NusG
MSTGWWAMYTLARREKELARRLRALEIPHYCPLIRKRFRSPSGRVRESFVPLFPGYVFLCGDQQQRYQALTTNCISRCLEVPDGTQLCRELAQIHQLIESCALVTPEARLEPGRQVRVKSGPMMGMEGTVIRRQGKEWFVIAINFLQRGAAVMLEDYQLELV